MNTSYANQDRFRDLLMVAAASGKTVYENEIAKLNNMTAARKAEGKHSLQDIFRRYWPEFEEKYQGLLRPAIIANVHRMIECRDLSKGYLFYECPVCDNFHLTGLSCHSRFCPTCSQKYREHRTIEIEKKLLQVPHRHFVFTVAQELRDLFRIHRHLHNILFDAVNQTLTDIVQKSGIAKKTDRRAGFVCFLHTYGRDMKYNPHIHALVAERTMDMSKTLRVFSYFHFARMRRFFQLVLLKKISDHLKCLEDKSHYRSFQKLRTWLVNRYKDGFYMYGPGNNGKDSKVRIRKISAYIARYASHPAISESRIIDVDHVTRKVTWYYDPHEDDGVEEEDKRMGRQVITEDIFDFIKRLIIHIPDENFHLIRYYGFYSNRTTRVRATQERMENAVSATRRKNALRWRRMIRRSFGYDPVLCACGTIMKLNLDLSHLPLKGGP